MLEFIHSLSPEQWAIVAGLITPLVQYFLGRIKSFTSSHNWVISFLLPLLGTLAVFLASNETFLEFVPLYATVYTTGQTFYFTAIRWWKKYNELVEQLNSTAEQQF